MSFEVFHRTQFVVECPTKAAADRFVENRKRLDPASSRFWEVCPARPFRLVVLAPGAKNTKEPQHVLGRFMSRREAEVHKANAERKTRGIRLEIRGPKA